MLIALAHFLSAPPCTAAVEAAAPAPLSKNSSVISDSDTEVALGVAAMHVQRHSRDERTFA